jgi:pimeloyl-ACP methyl ester carboxylesterase
MLKSNRKSFYAKKIGLFLLVALLVLISRLVYWDIPVEELESDYANEQSEFMELNGLSVHYRDEGQGMPVVLVHGTAASLHTWDDWTDSLKKDYRVIRMDIPAFGLTGPHPDADYSIEAYVAFLGQFLDQLDIDSMYLAGNSLGGNIAWNFASEHPDKVKKLVLLDAAGYPSDEPDPWIFGLARTPVLNLIVSYLTPRFIIKNNLEQVYFDDSKITDSLVTRYHRMSLRAGNRQAFIDRAKTPFVDHTAKLEQLDMPTLILWGDHDTWIPLEDGQKFAWDIEHSELLVLENTGHVPMEESPEESVGPMIDFLKR